VPGGAAAKAGPTAGEVTTSLDRSDVTAAATLNKVVDSLKPGQSVSIGYPDIQGQALNTTVTLGSGPPA